MASQTLELRARWDDLTSFVNEAIREKWWKIIVENHAPRAFFNLDHLTNMFNFYDEHKDKLKDRWGTAFAVFFKNLEYDVKSHDSAEKSAARLREFCSETTFDQENYVADLIVQSGSNCTDAHLTKDAFGEDDLHFLIDFDSAFLGDDYETYSSSSEAIRKEYSHLNDKEYREQRLKLLQLFLQVPNIFATKEFRDKYEKQARKNISDEIEKLKE